MLAESDEEELEDESESSKLKLVRTSKASSLDSRVYMFVQLRCLTFKKDFKVLKIVMAPHANVRQPSNCSPRHIQNGHRTTRMRTPTLKNAARATTKHRVTIQNGHCATGTHTPSFKMPPAPQRNTTLRFKMATAPHAHARQASKCSLRHNGTPRYDPKLPPRHTETLNHNVVLASNKKYIYTFFFASTTLRLSTAPQREPNFSP